ncbi:ornithine carbamoyltransferase [Paraferrimonas sedimenticola]|uniref:Ornithine carbamoyltransferase n=1 Tax=Paraferrimonas sedimenticola TaxID=375674 RepID=A0AA37RVF7_9GAMM|nr:ornithine carbamoyltransferase [Paraferrimonas sedimenticola]GLP95986.1 ornithine carbamoyltransferase [Paraferrimonas sedimenticola]
MQHFLTLQDLSAAEFKHLLQSAAQIKANPSDYAQALAGKSVVMLFEKPSLRTRVSFDIGINKLGGHCLYLDQQNGALGVRESVADFAGNISCWADAIVARTFAHSTIEGLAKHGSVPVINALSELYHPCQGLADWLTLSEHFDDLASIKLAYVGDGNNVTHSLMFGAALAGASLVICCPKGHFPDAQMVSQAQAIAAEHGGSIELSSAPSELGQLDAIYTDTWISMGDSTKLSDIETKFMPFQVNAEMMAQTQAQHFMHCLPAHRGEEVTAEVIDGPKSRVLQQAENRMHAQNAVLVKLFESGE